MHVEITFLRAFLIAEHNFGVFSFYTFFDIFIFEEKKFHYANSIGTAMAFTPFFERETTLLVLHRTTLCPILTFFNLDVIKKFFASFESGLAVFFYFNREYSAVLFNQKVNFNLVLVAVKINRRLKSFVCKRLYNFCDRIRFKKSA